MATVFFNDRGKIQDGRQDGCQDGRQEGRQNEALGQYFEMGT